MSDRNTVVLVDAAGSPIEHADKIVAHQAPGQLHEAFSVVLFDPDGKTLLQQRAALKYHFPLYWANVCCSHPGPGEEVVSSATSRVLEELGVRVTLSEVGTFIYRAECPVSGLVEHEFDHVLVGYLAEQPSLRPSAQEVAATRWIDPGEIDEAELGGPLAPWLCEALALVLASADHVFPPVPS